MRQHGGVNAWHGCNRRTRAAQPFPSPPRVRSTLQGEGAKQRVSNRRRRHKPATTHNNNEYTVKTTQGRDVSRPRLFMRAGDRFTKNLPNRNKPFTNAP